MHSLSIHSRNMLADACHTRAPRHVYYLSDTYELRRIYQATTSSAADTKSSTFSCFAPQVASLMPHMHVSYAM